MSFKIFVFAILVSLLVQAQTAWVCFTRSQLSDIEYYELFELGEDQRILITPKRISQCDKKVKMTDLSRIVYAEGDVSDAEVIFRHSNKGIYKLDSKKILNRGDNYSYVRKVDFSKVHKLTIPKSVNFKFRTSSTVSLSKKRLINYLQQVSGETPINLNNKELLLTDRYTKEGAKNTWTYLQSFFNKLGFETRLHCYSEDGFFKRKACNVEATKYGKDKSRFVVVGGHFDSVTQNCADDNGTGIAAIMEMAIVMKDRESEIGVKFLAFDQEERGLIGSKAYAKLVKSEGVKIEAAFIIDTVGYDSDNDGKMHIIDCDKKESVKLSSIFMRGMSSTLEQSPTCTNRSDHSSFWNIGVPAIIVSENFFGGDANPCYHKKCDTIKSLNLDYFFNIAESLAKAVASSVAM